MHELGDAFVFGKLAEGEDGFFLYGGVGIVFYCGGDGGRGFLTGLLGEPEDGLAANLWIGVRFGHLEELVSGSGFGVDGEVED